MIRVCAGPSTRVLRSRNVIQSTRSYVDLARAKQAWNGNLVLSEEVEHALAKQQPVVALESTIITHGMPHPTNHDTALSLESILRSRSITPATIALINGRIHVGLTPSELSHLSSPPSPSSSSSAALPLIKISRRDLHPAIALRRSGGTTVASTMFIASSVGIPLFVTGGIGGVHRGAESSMDISADLLELGRAESAIGLICAGAKSILDIPRTMEVLETQGVCVAAYGQESRGELPAFYTPRSGVKAPWHVQGAGEAAAMIYAGLRGMPRRVSTLIGVPILTEGGVAEKGEEVQKAVEQAVRESVEQGVDKRGKEVTPWLLKRVGELTGGSALELNVKLIENNARVGAEIALELAKLRKDERERMKDSHASSSAYFPSSSLRAASSTSSTLAPPLPASSSTTTDPLPPPTALVFGSAALDITSIPSTPLLPGTTTPGQIHLSPGGVARNIAEAAQRFLEPHAVQLNTLIGRDIHNEQEGREEADGFGRLLMLEMEKCGLRTDGLVLAGGGKEGEGTSVRRTAGCTLMLDGEGGGGDLVNGVADMSIVEGMTAEMVRSRIEQIMPKMVVFDCNPTAGVLQAILSTCLALSIPTLCDPTSTPKLPRLVPALTSLIPSDPSAPRPLSHLSPNLLELEQLHTLLSSSSASSSSGPDPSWEYINSLNLLADWRAKVDAFAARDRQWLVDEGVARMMVGLLPFAGELWVKAGKRGVLHCHVCPSSTVMSSGRASVSHELEGVHRGKKLVVTHWPALRVPEEEVVSTTGAGDTLVGGIVAGLVSGEKEEVFIGKALEGVGRTMRSRRAVG